MYLQEWQFEDPTHSPALSKHCSLHQLGDNSRNLRSSWPRQSICLLLEHPESHGHCQIIRLHPRLCQETWSRCWWYDPEKAKTWWLLVGAVAAVKGRGFRSDVFYETNEGVVDRGQVLRVLGRQGGRTSSINHLWPQLFGFLFGRPFYYACVNFLWGTVPVFRTPCQRTFRCELSSLNWFVLETSLQVFLSVFFRKGRNRPWIANHSLHQSALTGVFWHPKIVSS